MNQGPVTEVTHLRLNQLPVLSSAHTHTQLSQVLAHVPYSLANGDGVCIWLHTDTPGCSAAIAWARARLLPPTWSSTASTNLLHVGLPNLST